MSDVFQYQTRGTCSKLIAVEIDNNKIKNIQILGGCMGNLTGISKLVIGMDIDDVISKLQGIDCGGKGTSCPDQIARCLIQYKESKK